MSSHFFRVTDEGIEAVTVPDSTRNKLRADALEMFMFSVGEGEAIILKRRGLATLIDGGAGGGSNAPLGHFLYRWLLDHNLKLKAFDASHPHVDHLNAVTTLLQEGGDGILAPGATFLDNGEVYGTTLKNTLVAELGRHNLAVVHVKGGNNPTTFRLASSVTAKLFTYPHSSHGTNYQSVFMAVKFRNARFLFTGDVYDEYEKHLLQSPNRDDLPAHVLKITHHGSSGGSCQEFVDHVKPRIAVASSTTDADHRLEQDVRGRLARYAEVFDTATANGDVVVRTDGKLQTIEGKQGVLFEVETISPGLYPH